MGTEDTKELSSWVTLLHNGHFSLETMVLVCLGRWIPSAWSDKVFVIIQAPFGEASLSDKIVKMQGSDLDLKCWPHIIRVFL